MEIHRGWIRVMKGQQRREITAHLGIGADAAAPAAKGIFRCVSSIHRVRESFLLSFPGAVDSSFFFISEEK